ncbi:MAG: hypothetical protein PVH29_05820 [Candidatus Zixiibacteriota bacterium]|jgi:hypothetical protein
MVKSVPTAAGLAVAAALIFGACGPAEKPASTAEVPEGADLVRGSITVLGPEDRPLPAGVAFYEAGDHARPSWQGLAGEEYGLAAGRYDLLIEYFGQKYWQRGVEPTAGENAVRLPMATFSVDFSSSRGDRLAGRVELYPAGLTDEAPVMEGETYEGLAVLAGVYDVRVTVQDRERWLRGVELEAGDYETKTLVEPVGYLRVDVVDQDGEPLEAEVWAYGPASGHEPAAIGTSYRPMALLPGRYDVAVRWAGTRDFSSGVAVLRNQTTVEVFTFWRSEAP